MLLLLPLLLPCEAPQRESPQLRVGPARISVCLQYNGRRLLGPGPGTSVLRAQRLPGTFLGESCFPFSLAAARPRLPRAQSGIIISYFDLLFCLLFCNTFAAVAAVDSLSFLFCFISFFLAMPFVILAADPDCALCGFLRFAPFAIIMQIFFNGFALTLWSQNE